eukprot:39208_1
MSTLLNYLEELSMIFHAPKVMAKQSQRRQQNYGFLMLKRAKRVIKLAINRRGAVCIAYVAEEGTLCVCKGALKEDTSEYCIACVIDAVRSHTEFILGLYEYKGSVEIYGPNMNIEYCKKIKEFTHKLRYN